MLGSNDYFVPKPLNYFAYFRPARASAAARRAGGPADLIAQLSADGWIDLTNSRRDDRPRRLPVELLGLDDAHIRWHDLRVAPRTTDRFGDRRHALARLGARRSRRSATTCSFAGHTHGGQVCLPVVGALVTNCSMPRRLVGGLIRMGSAIVHTSRGLGTSKYAPFRFWCRPEATILRLRRGDDGAARYTELTSGRSAAW